jgi:hypothetical protein
MFGGRICAALAGLALTTSERYCACAQALGAQRRFVRHETVTLM